MRDTLFDPWELLLYLKARWHAVGLSCVSAVAIALAVSVMLPKRYTATAAVLIQAPGGNDPRAATAINPVYLESLKVYERMASSDTLFVRALQHVNSPREAGRSIESAKRSILRVSKQANTAVLEISANMTDPVKAQALAQYIAEQTVQANLAIDSKTEAEMTRELRNQRDTAAERLAVTRKALEALHGPQPLTTLESQLENNADLKLSIEKELSQVRTEMAGYRASTQSSPLPSESETESLRSMSSSALARISALEAQSRDLAALLKDEGAQTEDLKARRDSLLADQKAAQTAFDTSNARLNDIVASTQFRGERLIMIDSGIVPQQPSSPNILLNVVASLALGFSGGVAWLFVTFSYRRARDIRASRIEPVFTLHG